MKESPILFNAEMVRAVLDGRKTQTRRIIKPQPEMVTEKSIKSWAGDPETLKELLERNNRGCPYGQRGDRLWVKETWRPEIAHLCAMDACDCADVFVRYAAGGPGKTFFDRDIPDDWLMPKAAAKGNISRLFIPRWASRITLEIVSVRVERLLSISDEDAIAEGCYTDDEYSDMAGGADVWPCLCDGYQVHEHGSLAGASEVGCHSCNSPKKRFSQLWQWINGFDSWDANPWVWVVEFKRVEQ